MKEIVPQEEFFCVTFYCNNELIIDDTTENGEYCDVVTGLPSCTWAGPYTTAEGETSKPYGKSGNTAYYRLTCSDKNGYSKQHWWLAI
jgi:hypothetical protein